MTSKKIVSVKANNYTQSGSRLLDWSVLHTRVRRRPLLPEPGVVTNGQSKFIKRSALLLAGKRGFFCCFVLRKEHIFAERLGPYGKEMHALLQKPSCLGGLLVHSLDICQHLLRIILFVLIYCGFSYSNKHTQYHCPDILSPGF